MSDQPADLEAIDIYEMRISYALHPQTGEPLIGFHEYGEPVSLILQLGMLDLTRTTVLDNAMLGDDDD